MAPTPSLPTPRKSALWQSKGLPVHSFLCQWLCATLYRRGKQLWSNHWHHSVAHKPWGICYLFNYVKHTQTSFFKKSKKQPVLCSFSLHAVYYRPNEDISPRLRDFKKQFIYDSFFLTATATCIAQKLKIILITMLPRLFQATEYFYVAQTYREFSI